MTPRHFVLDARTATPHFPGIGRYVRNLARALAPRLDSTEHLTLLTDPRWPLHLEGASTVDVAASPFSLGQQLAVRRALRAAGADLYHSPYYLMPYLPSAPTVLTIYDVIPLRYPQFSSAKARGLFRLTMRLALRAARQVIAITEDARQDFVAEFHVRPEHITSVPLAADPAFGPQPPEVVETVRRKHRLPGQFALYLGSNKPHKNLVGLVAAWSELVEQEHAVRGCELVIAGAWDGRYPEARQLADAGTRMTIHWLGPVPDADLPALYAAATVFVFPSLYEGFGLPVIEAMACGTPVICSNVTALPEVAGDAAILVDPADRSALTAALAQVLDSPALREDLQGRGLVRAGQFSWERTAARTLEIYRRL